MEIIFNEDKIEALGLTVSAIRRKLTGNQGAKTFAGRVVDNNKYLYVNVDAEYNDISELQNVVITSYSIHYTKLYD